MLFLVVFVVLVICSSWSETVLILESFAPAICKLWSKIVLMLVLLLCSWFVDSGRFFCSSDCQFV